MGKHLASKTCFAGKMSQLLKGSRHQIHCKRYPHHFTHERIKCRINIMRATQMLIQHYSDVIMGTVASQITGFAIVYSNVNSSADQGKHQSFASLAFEWRIHRSPVNSPHKWPVTQKMFPFDEVIMNHGNSISLRITVQARVLWHITTFRKMNPKQNPGHPITMRK